MAGAQNRVFDEALSLPVEERISLVEALLRSLNLPLQSDIDRAWQEEAEHRVDEIVHGELQTISAADALATIRERHQR